MTTIERIGRVKQHTVYKTKNGQRVPGVTTVLGVIHKPALVPWANNLGLQGIKADAYVDKLADVGTLAHAWIHSHLFCGRDPEPDVLAGYTAEQISLAQNSVLKFFEWEKQHKVKALWGERPLVSERHQYGGTIDLWVAIDGTEGIVDIKTSKAIYDDHLYQVGGYALLAESNGYNPAWCRIIQVGRSEEEGFGTCYKPIEEMEPYKRVFLLALDLYRALKAARS